MKTIYPLAPSSASLDAQGITGRDGYIIAESLLRYIVTEQNKPRRMQAWSDLQDARAIFNAYCGSDFGTLLAFWYPNLKISLIDEKASRRDCNVVTLR